jgi:hypothetical protein
MEPKSWRIGIAASAVLVLMAACSDTALPGTLLGTYKVQASPQSNTCGAGLGAPDPWNFDVQLSESNSVMYWSWLDGTPPLSSALGASGTTTLTNTQSGNVDATADGGVGPCTMQRNDTIEIALSSGSPPAMFAGTIQYAFSVPSGANCADQLAASGGSYATLPCTIAYTMTGARQ